MFLNYFIFIIKKCDKNIINCDNIFIQISISIIILKVYYVTPEIIINLFL